MPTVSIDAIGGTAPMIFQGTVGIANSTWKPKMMVWYEHGSLLYLVQILETFFFRLASQLSLRGLGLGSPKHRFILAKSLGSKSESDVERKVVEGEGPRSICLK